MQLEDVGLRLGVAITDETDVERGLDMRSLISDAGTRRRRSSGWHACWRKAVDSGHARVDAAIEVAGELHQRRYIVCVLRKVGRRYAS